MDDPSQKPNKTISKPRHWDLPSDAPDDPQVLQAKKDNIARLERLTASIAGTPDCFRFHKDRTKLKEFDGYVDLDWIVKGLRMNTGGIFKSHWRMEVSLTNGEIIFINCQVKPYGSLLDIGSANSSPTGYNLAVVPGKRLGEFVNALLHPIAGVAAADAPYVFPLENIFHDTPMCWYQYNLDMGEQGCRHWTEIAARVFGRAKLLQEPQPALDFPQVFAVHPSFHVPTVAQAVAVLGRTVEPYNIAPAGTFFPAPVVTLNTPAQNVGVNIVPPQWTTTHIIPIPHGQANSVIEKEDPLRIEMNTSAIKLHLELHEDKGHFLDLDGVVKAMRMVTGGTLKQFWRIQLTLANDDLVYIINCPVTMGLETITKSSSDFGYNLVVTPGRKLRDYILVLLHPIAGILPEETHYVYPEENIIDGEPLCFYQFMSSTKVEVVAPEVCRHWTETTARVFGRATLLENPQPAIFAEVLPEKPWDWGVWPSFKEPSTVAKTIAILGRAVEPYGSAVARTFFVDASVALKENL